MASEGSRGRCLDREGATGYAPDLPPLQEGVEDTSVPRHEAQLGEIGAESYAIVIQSH